LFSGQRLPEATGVSNSFVVVLILYFVYFCIYISLVMTTSEIM